MEGQGTRSAHEQRKRTLLGFPAFRASRGLWTSVITVALAAWVSLFAPPTIRGFADAPTTIVDEWTAVKVPPPPMLKPLTVAPTTTAVLILDILKQTCNLQRRPRCVASVPKIAAFQTRATEAKMLVIYSVVPGAQLDDILLPVRPLPGQPVVTSFLNKFQETNLDALLKSQNIKTVIVTGTSAQGAVLHTSAEAALRGLQVVVPVDLMSAELLYAEQYTAWHLANAPVISDRLTLTRSDLIRF